MLAEMPATGSATQVPIRDPDEESLRDLFRLRSIPAKDPAHARQHVNAALLRHRIHYPNACGPAAACKSSSDSEKRLWTASGANIFRITRVVSPRQAAESSASPAWTDMSPEIRSTTSSTTRDEI